MDTWCLAMCAAMDQCLDGEDWLREIVEKG
jgi:hypothetical protein